MKITKPEIYRRDKEAVYSVQVESREGTEMLWYAVEEKHAGFLSGSSDAPLLAMLIVAMTLGEDIHLAGAVSERLWFNLAGPYQRLLRYVMPTLRPVKIFPASLHPETARAPGVATGFSCGVDSYCVLADHHFAPNPAGYRLTHLLYNNVGSHGKGGERLFKERYELVKKVVDRIGLPLVWVNSNLSAFYQTKYSFQQTHTPRNGSVALLLQQGIGCYLYASGYSFSDLAITASDDMARSDVAALPMFSTAAIEMFSVGSEYTRVEKTLRIAEISESYHSLDVCVGGQAGGNCSKCRKCMRTMLTLDIGGKLDRYAPVFDLEIFRRERNSFLATVIAGRHPLQREIVRFAKERGYVFPLSSRVKAALFRPQEKR